MPFETSMLTARTALTVAISIAALAVAQGAAAQEPAAQEKTAQPAFTYQAVLTADVQGVASGGAAHGARYLHNIDLVGDLDLEKAIGWRGATLHGYILNNAGGAPNDLAGTLQGVDNIEVALPRTRLFELWIEQALGEHASLRAGLYNLNSEFYANDSAGQLIAPPFGIGSELAATGPNGPSIFPSTGLGARLNINLGEASYLRMAVLNAKSGVVGDPGGVDFGFSDGVLGIAEFGRSGPARLAIGAWRYSEKQEDIRDTVLGGGPALRTAQGIYLLGDHPIFEGKNGQAATGFFRVGLSDGDTTPFSGGWQAGIQVAKPFASRPDSAFSIGVQQGHLATKFRANLNDVGIDPGRAESGVEMTYSDRLGSRITVQPDLQWTHTPGGDKAAKDVVLVALRLKVALASR
jgi:porin